MYLDISAIHVSHRSESTVCVRARVCVVVVDLLAAFRVNLSVDVIRLLWIILTEVPPRLHDTLTYTLADFQMSAR